MIKEYFGDKTKIRNAIYEDEVVAYGAALVASQNYIVSSEKNNILSNLNIKDVVPLTLGVGSKDHMIPMIKKIQIFLVLLGKFLKLLKMIKLNLKLVFMKEKMNLLKKIIS